MRITRPEPVSPGNFGHFGRVVAGPGGTPTSEAPDYKFWSDLAHYAISGETEIGVCTVYRQPSPTVTGMERHRRTPEILIPIDAPFDLPLLRDGEPETQIRAFRVQPGQAVVIDPEIWHGACLPVGASQASYFVIFRRGTPQQDVEKKTVQAFQVQID